MSFLTKAMTGAAMESTRDEAATEICSQCAQSVSEQIMSILSVLSGVQTRCRQQCMSISSAGTFVWLRVFWSSWVFVILLLCGGLGEERGGLPGTSSVGFSFGV